MGCGCGGNKKKLKPVNIPVPPNNSEQNIQPQQQVEQPQTMSQRQVINKKVLYRNGNQ